MARAIELYQHIILNNGVFFIATGEIRSSKLVRVCLFNIVSCICRSAFADYRKLAWSRLHGKGVCEDSGSVSCSSSGHLKRDSLVCVCARVRRANTHSHTLNIWTQHGDEAPRDTTTLPRLTQPRYVYRWGKRTTGKYVKLRATN